VPRFFTVGRGAVRRGAIATALTAVLAARPGLAADAPPAPAPPAQPPKKKPVVPEIVGIRWEPDFEAGLRRAAREGRPVFVAVNALEGEGANEMLRREAYPSESWGRASRPFVCFAANGEQHEERKGPDGQPACARFGQGPCAAHKDALVWTVRRFGSMISPQHAVLEPDGATAYHKDYFTGEEGAPFLDAWAARLCPRLVARRVWSVRDLQTRALTEAHVAALEVRAKEWLASGDGYAPAGVVAVLEQETDAARRAALFAALRTAPPDAEAALFDPVDAATASPEADREATAVWVDVALAVAPELGDWAAARVVPRVKDGTAWVKEFSRWSRTARRIAPPPHVGRPLPEGLRDPSRDVRRASLWAASPSDVRAAREAVREALGDRVEEVRVAAALALRRAGDPTGAETLLSMLADPVEGPDVRRALVAWRGEDLGEDPAAWDEVLRAEGGPR
jgi:hypothetical protein